MQSNLYRDSIANGLGNLEDRTRALSDYGHRKRDSKIPRQFDVQPQNKKNLVSSVGRAP